MAEQPADRQGQVDEALRRYRLPTGGEFPFVPPKGWHPTMPLHPGGPRGYIDVKGRRWQPGRSITPGQPIEWDVQLPAGGHVNVDLDGRISHGAGKPPRPTTPQIKAMGRRKPRRGA